jgi:DnaK suppressor protein
LKIERYLEIMKMNKKTLLKLSKSLLKQQDEILKHLEHLETELKVLQGPVIEHGDEAQKDEISYLLHRLDEREKEEIKEINLAFDRIATGKYGICELCGEAVSIRRLETLPATRLCSKCAQRCEKTWRMRKHPRDEITNTDLLEECRNLCRDDT